MDISFFIESEIFFSSFSLKEENIDAFRERLNEKTTLTEEDLYKNKYRTLLPITTTLTEATGDVTLWLLIFDMTNTEKIKLLNL